MTMEKERFRGIRSPVLQASPAIKSARSPIPSPSLAEGLHQAHFFLDNDPMKSIKLVYSPEKSRRILETVTEMEKIKDIGELTGLF